MKLTTKHTERLKSLLSQQHIIGLKIKLIRSVCDHEDYEVIRTMNDHDGWSRVEFSWYELRKCNDCGDTSQVKTGTEQG